MVVRRPARTTARTTVSGTGPTAPRRPASAPCIVVTLLSLGLLCSNGLFRVQQSALSVLSAQQRVADMILLFAGLLYYVVVTVLPGCAVVALAYMLYTKWDRMNRVAWAGVIIVLFFLAVLWALRVRGAAESAEKMGGAGTPSAVPTSGFGAATTSMGPVGPVRSGEEVCDNDGKCTRLADPTKPEGPVAEGWQQSLAGAMTDAIRRGEEQVVLLFSREGCPWCERQVPVIHRAIQKRARDSAAGVRQGAAAPALAFLGGGAGSLLFAPLRVFVLDAGEFPYLAQQFGIEAFPTSMVFGLPGVTPMIAKGFLDDDSFEQIVRTAAVAPPPAGGVPGIGGGGGGPIKPRRRRFFR